MMIDQKLRQNSLNQIKKTSRILSNQKTQRRSNKKGLKKTLSELKGIKKRGKVNKKKQNEINGKKRNERKELNRKR